MRKIVINNASKELIKSYLQASIHSKKNQRLFSILFQNANTPAQIFDKARDTWEYQPQTQKQTISGAKHLLQTKWANCINYVTAIGSYYQFSNRPFYVMASGDDTIDHVYIYDINQDVIIDPVCETLDTTLIKKFYKIWFSNI